MRWTPTRTRNVPFEQLVEHLKPERHASHSPLFQAMLIVQNTPGGSLDMPGLTMQTLAIDDGGAKFDLTLDVAEAGERLPCSLEFNTDLFERSTIERMAGHFTRLLDAIASAPQQALGTLAMLAPAEHARSRPGMPPPARTRRRCIHQLFEAQAQHSPDAQALVAEAETLSYSALNARANQLARHLRAHGVGPDVVVGLCAERSLDMVVALLAILKAGGAYLPLDPAYPASAWPTCWPTPARPCC